MHRDIAKVGGTYALREESEAYASDFGSQNEPLRPDNTILWDKNAESAET